MKKTILLADNHLEFLETRAEYLELAGYTVIKASNPTDARRKIMNENIHLAILDKRLLDDSENDRSGLDLAKDAELRFTPSIILTGWPTVADVREALRRDESSGVDYVMKTDGAQALLDAVNKAFAQYIPINWDLVLDWEDSDLSIPGLIGILSKDEHVKLQVRCDEIEDLLRMVFTNFSKAHFIKKIWTKNNRTAILVQAHSQFADRVFVLTLGNVPEIEKEISHQAAFPDDPGAGCTEHEKYARRAHYAANLWRLGGAEIDQLEPLSTAADGLRNRFAGVIENLVLHTLDDWHNQRDPEERKKSLLEFYTARYPLFALPDPQAVFIQRVKDVASDARRYNQVRDLGVDGEQLTIDLPGKGILQYPDPAQVFFGQSGHLENTPIYTQNSPGILDPNSILVGGNNQTWLTDFAEVGVYPIWHDFAQLESELRFNFVDSVNLSEIFEIEKFLRPSWPQPAHNNPGFSADWNKYVTAILRVREYSYERVRNEPKQYALCLLFAVLSDFLGADAPVIRTRRDVARLVHRLLLSGIICADLMEENLEEQVPHFPLLVVDEKDGVVKLGKRSIDVTGTEFKLLCYLYKYKGKRCERKAICKEVFDIRDEPSYNQLHGLIDANLNRLREKIEPDLKQPHYILTKYNQGICLEDDPGKEDN